MENRKSLPFSRGAASFCFFADSDSVCFRSTDPPPCPPTLRVARNKSQRVSSHKNVQTKTDWGREQKELSRLPRSPYCVMCRRTVVSSEAKTIVLFPRRRFPRILNLQPRVTRIKYCKKKTTKASTRPFFYLTYPPRMNEDHRVHTFTSV